MLVVLVLLLASASVVADQEKTPIYGPDPKLSAPRESWFPTLRGSIQSHWPEGAKPSAASGLAVSAYAKDLKHPRWLYTLPNGDVLVAEAATVAKPATSLMQVVRNWMQRRAGATVESANRITLLRDGDGIVDERSTLLEGLRQPFGMVLANNQLYVANTDSVMRFTYREGETRITEPGTKIADLPVGHHWTRNLLASPDGSSLYVTVGSGSNVAEDGMASENRRASILKIDLTTGDEQVFASGLRNPNGMAFEPTTGVLWTVVNERDLLGDDTPPDYLTSVKEGGFFGWPYSYWGQHVDDRVKPQRPDLVAKAIIPDYALGAHTASLGLAYYDGTALPLPYRGGMFVSQHGSWNRSSYSGYKVIFVPFKDGKPNGQPLDVLTGFLKSAETGTTYGRPVGLAVDRAGALLVADDTGNTVWRITSGHATTATKSGQAAHP